MAFQLRQRGPEKWIPLLLLPVIVAIFYLVLHGTVLLQTTHRVIYLPGSTAHAGAHGRHHLHHPLHAGGSGGTKRSAAGEPLTGEVWAGFAPHSVSSAKDELATLLSEEDKTELQELCGRCLYHQLNISIQYGNSHKVFVATGDIASMWIRDSAVQLGVLLPRMAQRPALRMLVEGAVRTQAFMTIQDPYANAYNLKWQHPSTHDKGDRLLGRGGWVSTRNYELDSGAYFMHLLWNLYSMPGYNREALLAEPVIFEAASLLVDIWTLEQRHEELSQYRYSELPRNGLGPLTKYTGMSWCGFRPSDEPQQYGYNIPVNMYAQAALERALELNANIWRSKSFEDKARALAESMREGIEKFGVVQTEDGVKVYAFEVDGMGNALFDYDDANVPSLLSIPLLGYKYNKKLYTNTRERILSKKNPFFYEGSLFSGIGSSHTQPGMAWPLALMVQALTTDSVTERAQMLQTLLKLQCGNGLMHESVNVENPMTCTRMWFGWANAMLVALVESSLGYNCIEFAEKQRLHDIQARETQDQTMQPRNQGPDDPLYYETLEATMWFDQNKLNTPAYIG